MVFRSDVRALSMQAGGVGASVTIQTNAVDDGRFRGKRRIGKAPAVRD